MNYIEVSGGKAKEREVVEATILWCIQKMMPRMRTLDIEVRIKNIQVHGYCMMTDTNRHFELEIRKGLDLYNLISTVCHEMIHVKQYARKELSLTDAGRNMWKSKQIPEDVQYMDLPWEKEAFGKEEVFALECFKQLSVSL
jgi:hypothetical protein